MSVSDFFYSQVLVCLFCCRKICGLILEIYNSLTDTCMWKLGLRPRNFFSGNTYPFIKRYSSTRIAGRSTLVMQVVWSDHTYLTYIQLWELLPSGKLIISANVLALGGGRPMCIYVHQSLRRPNSWTKSRQVLKVFLLVIQSHLYSFALIFPFLQSHATSYSFCKGERRKTWKKTISSSLRFTKSIQKPQVWELLKLSPETSMKLHVHEFCFQTWRISPRNTWKYH
jgi:hypothetical protein